MLSRDRKVKTSFRKKSLRKKPGGWNRTTSFRFHRSAKRLSVPVSTFVVHAIIFGRLNAVGSLRRYVATTVSLISRYVFRLYSFFFIRRSGVSTRRNNSAASGRVRFTYSERAYPSTFRIVNVKRHEYIYKCLEKRNFYFTPCYTI